MTKPHPKVEPAPHSPSEVRFSLRHVLIVAAYVAVTLVVSAWLARDASNEERAHRAAFFLGAFAATTVLAGLFAWQQRRSECRAGELLFRVPCSSCILPVRHESAHRYAIVLAAVAFAWILARSAYGFVDELPSWPMYSGALAGSLFGVMLGACLGARLQMYLWLAEHGVVRHSAFIPWSEYDAYSWHGRRNDILVLKGPGHRAAVRVPAHFRNSVEELLCEKLSMEGDIG